MSALIIVYNIVLEVPVSSSKKKKLKNIKSIEIRKKEVMLLTDDITVYVKKC